MKTWLNSTWWFFLFLATALILFYVLFKKDGNERTLNATLKAANLRSDSLERLSTLLSDSIRGVAAEAEKHQKRETANDDSLSKVHSHYEVIYKHIDLMGDSELYSEWTRLTAN